MDPIEAQEALDDLDELIRRLKIDFDRFFIGALPTPPETLRYKAFAIVRQLRTKHHKSAAVRFRINTLEAKLNSLNELFNRRMRALETGTVHQRRKPAEAEQRGPDPYSGVVVRADADPSGVEALYSELYGREGRGAKTDIESFKGFLLSQAKTIRDKTGCGDVVFRITSKAGKLSLKAKPGESSES